MWCSSGFQAGPQGPMSPHPAIPGACRLGPQSAVAMSLWLVAPLLQTSVVCPSMICIQIPLPALPPSGFPAHRPPISRPFSQLLAKLAEGTREPVPGPASRACPPDSAVWDPQFGLCTCRTWVWPAPPCMTNGAGSEPLDQGPAHNLHLQEHQALLFHLSSESGTRPTGELQPQKLHGHRLLGAPRDQERQVLGYRGERAGSGSPASLPPGSVSSTRVPLPCGPGVSRKPFKASPRSREVEPCESRRRVGASRGHPDRRRPRPDPGRREPGRRGQGGAAEPGFGWPARTAGLRAGLRHGRRRGAARVRAAELRAVPGLERAAALLRLRPAQPERAAGARVRPLGRWAGGARGAEGGRLPDFAREERRGPRGPQGRASALLPAAPGSSSRSRPWTLRLAPVPPSAGQARASGFRCLRERLRRDRARCCDFDGRGWRAPRSGAGAAGTPGAPPSLRPRLALLQPTQLEWAPQWLCFWVV